MRVLAALSGGVDSAVAAAIAVEAGHDVTGVHMALSSEPQACRVGSRGCCSVEDSADAARAAEIMGIPFYVWDLAAEFEDTVINDFLAEYKAGHTPNPCVRCNEFVKFRELADRAKVLGFDAVCTGHYARVLDGSTGPELHRGLDEAKDQSYVLAIMGEDELKRVMLPLGQAPSKAWVREQAEIRGLGVSNKPDSYDICFIPDGDTQGFLRNRIGAKPGQIVDSQGNVLGEHSGYYQFTVGQRKGLRIERPADDGKARYVLETRPDSNQVVVGAAELLSVNQIQGEEAVWLKPCDSIEIDYLATEKYLDTVGSDLRGISLNSIPDEILTVQMRAHGIPSIVVSLENTGKGPVVTLAEPVRGIAAGQSMVIYRGSQVVAESTIKSTLHQRASETMYTSLR